MKKGSPVKPTIKAPEETRNQDALVQVHMYNQNQASKQEGNRGVLRIKECQPQKWQTSPQDETSKPSMMSPGCSDQAMARLGCSECGYGSAHSVPSTSGDNTPDFSGESADSRLIATLPNDVRSVTPPFPDCVPNAIPVSETEERPHCKSESNRPDSKSENRLEGDSENQSPNTPESTPEITADARTLMRPLRDDIQIPVISSSTISPANKLSGKIKGVSTVAPQEKGEARRRTRSNVHQTGHGAESENMEQNTRPPNNNNEWTDQHGEKAGTSSKGKNSKGNTSLDSANRVLKSVNRGTPEVVGRSPTKTVIASKRKRNSDVEAVPVGEPTVKSARVHTRSHTWSHKSMITRSQEKTHKTPTRTSTTHKK